MALPSGHDIRATDERWMRQALALARRGEGLTRPNPPVGALVIRNGRVAGKGFHHKAGAPHAEVLAIRQAGEKAHGATLYITLEPCCSHGRTPPCTDLILQKKLRRVVFCVTDPNPKHRGKAVQILRKAGILVTQGVCTEEGKRLLAPFTKWITTGRPYLTLKLALSMDGRIADFRGMSKWITGERSRRRVQELRMRADAILVGAGTVMADDPSLLCRVRRKNHLHRIIVDAAGRVSPQARVFCDEEASSTCLVTSRACSVAKREKYARHGARVWVLPATRGRIVLSHLLSRLGKEGILHVVCEGGGQLAGSIVRQRLADEYYLFMAPIVLGGNGTPGMAGPGWRLSEAPRFAISSVERLGDDILLRAMPEQVKGRL